MAAQAGKVFYMTLTGNHSVAQRKTLEKNQVQ